MKKLNTVHTVHDESTTSHNNVSMNCELLDSDANVPVIIGRSPIRLRSVQ